MKKTLAALLTLTLLLAACGSDDETTQANAGGDTATTSAETDTPDDNPATTTDDGSTSDERDGLEPAPDDPMESADEPAEAADEPAESMAENGEAQPAGGGFSMNGFRYCEILLTADGDDGAPVSEVWGTQGVGPCRDEAWYALDPDALMAEFEATGIHMNGPRYFVVDGSVDTAPPTKTDESAPQQEIRSFGGIEMQLLATIGDGSAQGAAYGPIEVVRTITWTFNAGTEIYELTDPEGNTYVMQSYSLIQDPTLTADDLASLGDRLELPDGWTYSARTLDEDIQIALADGGAIVVQDELENSYQRN